MSKSYFASVFDFGMVFHYILPYKIMTFDVHHIIDMLFQSEEEDTSERECLILNPLMLKMTMTFVADSARFFSFLD